MKKKYALTPKPYINAETKNGKTVYRILFKTDVNYNA